MRRVLIIDDDDDFRTIISQVFMNLGYDVVAVESGKKGIELFDKPPHFDLVITDICMPRMDGNAVADHIRNSTKPDTPVVALTGFPDETQKGMFDALLSKPFNLENLKKVIGSFDQE